MLTCQELTEVVTDYLEGRMGFADRLRFRLHVGMCKPCMAFLRARKLTIQAVGSLPAEPMPTEVRDELLERFKSWKREGR